MDSEAPESSYRKRFPKGKDWKTPKKNPYGFCGLQEDSYHGMEVIAVSVEEHNKLKEELEQLKNDYHFSIRNKHMEYEMLRKDFSKLVTAMNTLLQNNPDDEYIKMVLEDIGVIPKSIIEKVT
jgi:adenosylmethionine-8-amino-7-oxononanoate aminotransferase